MVIIVLIVNSVSYGVRLVAVSHKNLVYKISCLRCTMFDRYSSADCYLRLIKIFFQCKCRRLISLNIKYKGNDINLRNSFLLTVIHCPVYYLLEVSREVDISRARSASDIFTDD